MLQTIEKSCLYPSIASYEGHRFREGAVGITHSNIDEGTAQ